MVVVDRIHDLGDAVPLGFRGEVLDQIRDGDRADDGDEDDADPPRAGRRVRVGVVSEGEFTQEHYVMNKTDQHAKAPGADAGHYACGDGHQEHEEKTPFHRLRAGVLTGLLS